MVVHVVRSGIRDIPLDEFLSEYSYVAVTRCPGNAESSERRERISQFSRKALAGEVKGYNYIGAALAPLKELWDLKNLDTLWRKSRRGRKFFTTRPNRSFCSEFIIDAYIACEYISVDDVHLSPSSRTPSGLAEENIFEMLGYMSRAGWDAISPKDHFLGGASWVLSEEGRKLAEKYDVEMLSSIEKLPPATKFPW